MDAYKIEPGRAAVSRAGRDKGNLYMICAVDGDFALAADGRSRTAERPKKKRLKHLRPRSELFPDIAARAAVGKKITDTEIRGALNGIETADRARADAGKNGGAAVKEIKAKVRGRDKNVKESGGKAVKNKKMKEREIVCRKAII